MSPVIALDLAIGTLALVGGILLRRGATRRPPSELDDEVAALDIGSALRSCGAAILVLGALAFSGLPGGFDSPLWSVLALGLGAIGASVFVLRARWEGWSLRGTERAPDRPAVASETGQFALLAGAAATFVAYVIGLVIGAMQPVHIVVALLVGTAGSGIGYAICSPRTIVRRRPIAAPPPDPHPTLRRRPRR